MDCRILRRVLCALNRIVLVVCKFLCGMLASYEVVMVPTTAKLCSLLHELPRLGLSRRVSLFDWVWCLATVRRSLVNWARVSLC